MYDKQEKNLESVCLFLGLVLADLIVEMRFGERTCSAASSNSRWMLAPATTSKWLVLR